MGTSATVIAATSVSARLTFYLACRGFYSLSFESRTLVILARCTLCPDARDDFIIVPCILLELLVVLWLLPLGRPIILPLIDRGSVNKQEVGFRSISVYHPSFPPTLETTCTADLEPLSMASCKVTGVGMMLHYHLMFKVPQLILILFDFIPGGNTSECNYSLEIASRCGYGGYEGNGTKHTRSTKYRQHICSVLASKFESVLSASVCYPNEILVSSNIGLKPTGTFSTSKVSWHTNGIPCSSAMVLFWEELDPRLFFLECLQHGVTAGQLRRYFAGPLPRVLPSSSVVLPLEQLLADPPHPHTIV
ncbi:hypothetical protein Tco_0861095 [Tanacetum coccineum]|uniref:Uncharacterized protein n=1 Tax=Tanacetum coccineum TaxID=301880 RepID=A0ABQ5BJU7_9ASTR